MLQPWTATEAPGDRGVNSARRIQALRFYREIAIAGLFRNSALRSPEAFSLYLQDRQAVNRYDRTGMEEGIADFQQALRLDPSLSPAATWLAWTYITQVEDALRTLQPGSRSPSLSAAASNHSPLADMLRQLGEVCRKLRDVGGNSVFVRCVAGKHRTGTHAKTAGSNQQLLSHGDAATCAVAGYVGRRHESRAIANEPEHVMLRYPAHARPIEVVTIEVLINIESNVTVFNFFKHVPLEEITGFARGAAMIIQPAREDAQGELRRVGLEAFDITDPEPVGLVGQESLEIPLQCFDALFQARIAVRKYNLVEIHVPPIVLGLLEREAIGVLAQGLIADLVQHPAQ